METRLCRPPRRRWALVLDLPIRDGNLFPAGQGFLLVPSFRPSYKGWKLLLSGLLLSPELVLDLPIRDGNYGVIGDTEWDDVGFRPSYKGWKPTRPATIAKTPWSVLDLPIRDGNVWSSSQGLWVPSVLDLPIRDGNHRQGRWTDMQG